MSRRSFYSSGGMTMSPRARLNPEWRYDEEDPPQPSSTDGAPCPICKKGYREGCEHLLSTWDYSEAGGRWAGNWENLLALRSAVDAIIDSEQLRRVKVTKKLLRKHLPDRLV